MLKTFFLTAHEYPVVKWEKKCVQPTAFMNTFKHTLQIQYVQINVPVKNVYACVYHAFLLRKKTRSSQVSEVMEIFFSQQDPPPATVPCLCLYLWLHAWERKSKTDRHTHTHSEIQSEADRERLTARQREGV